MRVIYDGLRAIPESTALLNGETDIAEIPTVSFSSQRMGALDLVIALQRGQPSIHIDPTHCDRNVVVFNPMCLAPGQAAEVVAAVQKLFA